MAHMCYFYIHEDHPSYLQWISKKKVYGNSRIDLTKITNISDNPTWKMSGIFKRMSNLLCLVYENANQKEVEMLLKFANEETKLFWWQGIQYFIKRAFDTKTSALDQKRVLADKLFAQADKDGSKTLEFEETKLILQKLHIEITKDYLKRLFEQYDKDKNNTIDRKEFQEIIADITQKKEIIPIFKEFCKGVSPTEEMNRNLEIMKDDELLHFYIVSQKEVMNIAEIRKIISCLRELKSHLSFNEMMMENSRVSKEKLKISLSEFTNLLFSMNNSIFDPNKLEIYQVYSNNFDYCLNRLIA